MTELKDDLSAFLTAGRSISQREQPKGPLAVHTATMRINPSVMVSFLVGGQFVKN
jgi:hypothetical protein